MDKRILLLLIVLYMPIIQTRHYVRPISKFTFLGKICTNTSCTNSMPIIAYYKGLKIETHNGTFMLKELHDQHEFYFLFTLDPMYPESKTKDDPNTIKHFKMPSSNKYLCYKVSKNPMYWNARFAPSFARQVGEEKVRDAWHIELVTFPIDQQKKVIHLPEHTILFLIDPSFIQKLEQEPWDTELNTVKFPKIIFKDTLNAAQMRNMNNHAFCTACDLDPFHRKPMVVKEVRPDNPHVIVSMTTD